MKFIDAHQHLSFDWGCGSVAEIIDIYRGAGCAKICLSACGEQFGQPENEEVAKAFKLYPEDIVGFGFFRLGEDSPEKVDSLYAGGFRGLKVINPKKPYNAREYYPVYERASHFRMPVLFHTGVVVRFPADGEYDTDSERMRPVFLDAIARAFPEIFLIGGHLGVPWIHEAYAVAAANHNVFFDLSGIINYIHDKPASFFQSIIFWERAQPKLVFGVDGAYGAINDCIGKYERLLETLKFSEEEAQKLFYGNMEEILRLDNRQANRGD